MEDQGSAVEDNNDIQTQSPEKTSEKSEDGQAGSSQSVMLPLIPDLKTDKEKAAWEKYKDQFKSLFDAMNKEGVEVQLVFSKSKEGQCGTDGGLNFPNKQPELEGSFAEHCHGSESQNSEPRPESNNNTQQKRGRGRPPKTKPDVGEDENCNDWMKVKITLKKRGSTMDKLQSVTDPRSWNMLGFITYSRSVRRTEKAKLYKKKKEASPVAVMSNKHHTVTSTETVDTTAAETRTDATTVETHMDTTEETNTGSAAVETRTYSDVRTSKKKSVVSGTSTSRKDADPTERIKITDQEDDSLQHTTPRKGPGRPRKSDVIGEKLSVVQKSSSKGDNTSERRRSSRFAIKEEPADEGYPEEIKKSRKKNNLVCENCDKEFMIECLLDRHLNFCKKENKTKVKVDLTSPVKVNKKRKTESDSADKVDSVEQQSKDEASDDKIEDENSEEEEENSMHEIFESDDEDWQPEPKTAKTTKQGSKSKVRKRGRPPLVKRENHVKEEIRPEDDDSGENLDDMSEEIKKEMKYSPKTIVDVDQLDLKPDGLECKICGRKFKDNKYLIRHTVIHTGEREYSCKLCAKKFTRKYDLHIHMIRVHSWVKSGRGIVKDETELEEGEIIIEVSSTKKVKTAEEEMVDKTEKCDFCQEEFQKLKELESHLEEKHSDVEKNFKCLECESNFAMHFQLKSHHQVVHADKSYTCDVCNKGFDVKAGLNAHLKTHTDIKSYLCDFCGKGFTLQKYLTKHKQRHLLEGKNDKDKRYICTVCNTVFDHLPEFQGHMKSHKEEELRIFHCDQCPKGFFKLAHLKRHLLTHASQRAFKCEECGKTYKDPDTLRKHQKFIHSLGKVGLPERTPLPCDQCDKIFYNSGHLKRHKFRHTGQKPYPCDECGKCFAEKKSLESHVRIHTGERPYECKDCGRRFVQIAHLNRHRFLHTGVRAFQCMECKKRFFERSDLKKHMRIHDHIKPFQCDLCDMSFAQKNVLVCHRRRHTGERPYVCDICSRGFTQLGSLQTHRRLHTGERPYKCSQCEEGFVSKERLKFHQFVHTGISPHICHICGKGFRLKFKLQSHIDSHEGVFRHKCNYCAKGFLEKSKLKRHLRQVHNEDGPRISYQSFTSNIKQEDYVEEDEEVQDNVKQEIIIRNLGQFGMKEGEAEEVIEYVTIPGNLTEADDLEATSAVSHITLETAGSNLATLMDGSNITIPQDSIIYQEGNHGEEVVYVVIPEENQTVILS